MLRRLFPVICLIFTIGIVKPSYAAPVVELLRNSGFEGSFRSLEEKNGSARLNGEIGDGWSDDSSWAEVAAIYRRDTTRPHGGATAQRIEVQEVRRGAVQMRQTIQGLKPGLRYTYRIWLRGRSDTPAIVFLQQTAAPYSALSARMVRLSDVWVPVTIPLKAAEGETEVAAMVRLGGTGTLWVDDARFVEGTLPTPSEANWQAAPDNLLPNGSFEAGLGAGWGAVSDNNITESRPIIDETAALIGRRSLRMDIMAPAPHFPGTVMDVHSPEVLVEPGMEYTVSVALKASLPNTQVALGLDGVSDRQYVMAGPEWQRFSFTRRPTTKSTRVLIVCYVDKATQVWMDAVQLQAGVRAAPEYQAQSPLELNLSTRRPGNVFHDGEDARLEITTGGAKTLPAGATLRSQVIDLYGTERSLPVVRLPAAALVIPPAAEQPRGLFKVRSQVVDTAGKPLSAPVECVWSRLPRPRDIAAEKSFFGSHFILTPEFCAIARAVGVRWVRLHDSSKITKWPMTEPQPGDWRFYDEGVQTARAAGVQILGMLDGAPAWASARKGVKHDDYFANHFAVPDAPGAIDSWRRYVSTVVGHYAGKIDYWEVWNEPWNRDPPFFLGTPALYGELLKAAYPTAKAANPKSTVIGIDTYPGHGDAFAEGAMQASGPAFYDIFSYHDYRGALKVGPDPAAMQHARQYRALQEKYGAVKPVWITEGSPGDPASFYSPAGDLTVLRQHGADFVRFYVSTMSTSAQRFFLYGMFGHAISGGANSHLEHDRALRVSLVTGAVLASLVDGLPAPVRSEPIHGVDAYEFRGDNEKTVTVLWSYDGRERKLVPPAGAKVLDMLGNPLSGLDASQVTNAPIYWLR